MTGKASVGDVAGVLPHASGELLFRPGCDAKGCWLPVRAKNKKGLPRLERVVTNEQLLPADWAHLASCL